MVKFSHALALLPLVHNTEGFSVRSSFLGRIPSTTVSGRSSQFPVSTKLNVGTQIDPEELFPLTEECLLTPQGFGFGSSTSRILTEADRDNGYYRANGADIVTDVMDGITNGPVDVSLVFDESTNKLLGIFTETDYIKVRRTIDFVALAIVIIELI